MKNRKIQFKKLSLQKNTIASVNTNSVQGGIANTTFLNTRFALVCDTKTNPGTIETLTKGATLCFQFTCADCPTKDNIILCPGTVVNTTLC